MIQRYDQCNWCGDEYGKDAVMTKADDGDYVLYEDYEKLMEYAQHKQDCNLLSPIPCVKYNGKEVGCDCGFEQALKKAGEPK